jgi:hypothetical protein
MHPAAPGELIETSFVASAPGPAAAAAGAGPVWTLTMKVVGDAARVSTLRVEQPYMGLGVGWPTPTTSWAELNCACRDSTPRNWVLGQPACQN